MITLTDVIDTRTGRTYSVVRVKENKARWFIPIAEEEEPEIAVETPASGETGTTEEEKGEENQNGSENAGW